MEIDAKKIEALQAPLPGWAVKPHPTRKGMSAIHPMAIIDRLNEVFGVGGWNFHTREIEVTKEVQNTKSGPRPVYVSAVHGTLVIIDRKAPASQKAEHIVLEQFGGSTNDDKGDALKGGATDALTKIASYLGIGASIYKGQGNRAPNTDEAPDDGLFELPTSFTI
jgi:hypothetical protein